jgi:hypothetical protein
VKLCTYTDGTHMRQTVPHKMGATTNEIRIFMERFGTRVTTNRMHVHRHTCVSISEQIEIYKIYNVTAWQGSHHRRDMYMYAICW